MQKEAKTTSLQKMCEIVIIEIIIVKMKNSHNLSLNQIRDFLRPPFVRPKGVHIWGGFSGFPIKSGMTKRMFRNDKRKK